MMLGDATTQDTTSGEVTPGGAASGEAAPGGVASGEAAPGGVASGEGGEPVAALTLGLAASWLPPERRIAELRAATCPAGAAAAVRALERRRSIDPVGVSRALDLLVEAYPGCDRSERRRG